jgi:hypothetical protein
MVHVETEILLFIVRYGSCLGKDSVVHYQLWCCFNTDSVVRYLERGSVVHYLTCCMFEQKFCFSLYDMEPIWTQILVFITSHIMQLGSSDIYSEVSFFTFLPNTYYSIDISPTFFSVALVNTGRRYIKCATGWTTKGLIHDKGEIFLFSKMTIPALRPDRP